VNGATGYAIYVSTRPSSGYKLVKTVGAGKKSATIKKFKGKAFNKNQKYYVYVKTLKDLGGTVLSSRQAYCWNTKSKKVTTLK